MFKLFHGEKSRFQHFCTLGLKKTGKSTLLGNMALNDIERGDGVILFDTQGGLANALIERIKIPRRDIYYLDCTHKFYPMGFNVFELQSKKEKEQELERGLIEKYFCEFIISQLNEDVLKNKKFKDFLDNLTRTALILSMNTRDVIKTMHSLEVTSVIEKRFDKLPDYLKKYWKEEVGKLKKDLPEDIMKKIKDKFTPLLESTMVSKITEETVSTFNLFELVTKGKVLLINIPEEELGELTVRIMMDLMMLKMKVATEIRHELDYEKKPLFLYLNEYPSYVSSLKDNIISEWLRTGEDSKVSLNITKQSRGVFYKRSDLVKYCRVLVLFKLHEDDANYICENHLKDAHVVPEDLISLDVAQVVLYMLNENEDRIVMQATTTPMPVVKQLHNYQQILERSIKARSRGLIELARSFR